MLMGKMRDFYTKTLADLDGVLLKYYSRFQIHGSKSVMCVRDK